MCRPLQWRHTKIPVGVTWGHRPHNFLAVRAIALIAHRPHGVSYAYAYAYYA